MSRILFIADFFADQVPGGGELNNEVLIEMLVRDGAKVECRQSHLVKLCDLLEADVVIVANFANLSHDMKSLISKKHYIIYEHDHKYLPSRNPGVYENYLAPKDKIINRGFYENARAVLCQSEFHKQIAEKNLELDNIVSLGGNLWSDSHLLLLEEMANVPKKQAFAVIESGNWHKGTQDALLYCKTLDLRHALIQPQRPSEFLSDLGQYLGLIFFPKTPETLSRVVVEARMMGMSTRTTRNVGAIHEDWFSKKGVELIDYMRIKREEIQNLVKGYLSEDSFNSQQNL